MEQVCKLIGVPLHPVCQEELYNPGREVSIDPNNDAILTPWRPDPDARLGYTPTGQKQEVQRRDLAIVSPSDHSDSS